MAAILNFKMADKLNYIQIRPYIMFEILGITNICITTILAIQLCSEWLLNIYIIDVWYIYGGHLEIQDGPTNQPIPNLIGDNISRIFTIKRR